MEEILQDLNSDESSMYFHIPFYDKSMEERYINYKKEHQSYRWEDIITYVNLGLDYEFYTNVQNIPNPFSLSVLVNKYNRLPGTYIPTDLEMIKPCFNIGGLVLRHDARISFEIMCAEAAEVGILLEAISTFRSFIYQDQVYLKNFTQELDIREYQLIRDKVSARAGHSEHQTGLAVDINDLEQTFEATPEGRWLAANSNRYGYILRYPKGKEHITGYDYEPWHFRYLGHELADKVYHSGLTFDEYYARYLS
ncbi:MAG: M15 family metallopeptidase [Mobilitalea sp.]